jgi:fused signal recognition particle receptor
MLGNILPRLKQGLSKTRHAFSNQIAGLFAADDKPNDNEFLKLEELLISADVGYSITEQITAAMREIPNQEYREAGGPKQILSKILVSYLKNTPDGYEKIRDSKPEVQMIIGVNGNGKTTSVGKLAAYYRDMGKTVILCAADTFRDAAIEQLSIWGKRSGFRVIRHQQGADASAVIFDSIKASIASKADYLLIDTAGRLHTKGNLMRELEKMQRVISKELPGAPHKIHLVLDATTGQNGIAQAKEFLESVKVTGLIIAKMDGTARGGFIFGIKQQTGLQVEFIGIGEKIGDLVPFDPEQFVEALILE